MNHRDLSLPELHALFALVRIGREATNRDLLDMFGFPIEKGVREKLVEKGLISCRTDEKPFVHEATNDGWDLIRSEFTASPPSRADRGTRVMYALLNEFAEYMAKHDVEMVDVFGAAYVPIGTAEIEAAARAAYAEIATEPGAWVRLDRLRAALPEVPAEDLDRALTEMHQRRQIQLAPETNQKGLSRVQREAALRLGGEEHHLVVIGVPE